MVATEKSIVHHGRDATEVVRENGRTEYHMLVPKSQRELLLDFSFNNLESVINKAQINSYTMLFLKEQGLDSAAEFEFETEMYRIETTVSEKYFGNDVPIHLVPEELKKKTLDAQLLLARDDVDEKLLDKCYASAYFTLNVRSGTFQSMATELIARESLAEDDMSEEDSLLGTILSLQEKQELIEEDLNENRAALRGELLPFAEEMTEHKLGNAALYLYANQIGDKIDSRVSMSKVRKLNVAAAQRLVESQDVFDADEVMVDRPDSRRLKREAPEIYALGISKSMSVEVTEI